MVDLTGRNLTTLEWSSFLIDTSDPEVTKGVKSVDVKENRLTRLPENFGSVFSGLVVLDLRKNQVDQLPEDISCMISLQDLYLDFNRFTSLPKELFGLSLKTLSISQNQLTTLPPEIGHCKTLEVIFAADNIIDTIPPEIGNCQSLQVVHVHNNNLTRIPSSMHKLRGLVEWSLEWFRYTTPPMPRVLKGAEWKKYLVKMLDFLAEKEKKGFKWVSCLDVLAVFSQKAFDVNGFDSKRRARLHVACTEGHDGVARALIEGKARIETLDSEGYSPLLIAVREEHPNIVGFLVNHKVDVNKGGGLFGSPLHVCTVNFDATLAVVLIAGKANVNYADNDGNTPLHVLMSVFNKGGRKSYQFADILLGAKADCNALNADQWAPLHLTARRGQATGVGFALTHMQDHIKCTQGKCDHPRPTNGKSLTCSETFDANLRGGCHMWGPIHLAGHASHSHAVETLIDMGCDVFLKNVDGRTARHVSRGNMSLAKLIRKAEEEWLWYRVHWRDRPADDPNLETCDAYRRQRISDDCLSSHWNEKEIQRARKLMFVDPMEASELLELMSNLISSNQNHRVTFLLSRQWAIDLILRTPRDKNNMSIVMYACQALNYDIIRYIFGRFPLSTLREMCQPKDHLPELSNEDTILHLICSDERPKVNAERAAICHFLLLSEVSSGLINARDVRGHTPLHRAAVLGDLQLVQVLLDFDADPNMREATTGWTPLHLAVGDYPMMLALLNDDRTLSSLCDHFEWPPLLEAVSKLDAKAVGLLVNAGARMDVDILMALDSAKKDLPGKRWMLALLGFNGFSVEKSEVVLSKADLQVFLQEETRPPPKGAPKAFYVPEHLAPRCSNCKVLFSVTLRRAWCRSCGAVLCSACVYSVSTRCMPLDDRTVVMDKLVGRDEVIEDLQISDSRLSRAIELSIAENSDRSKYRGTYPRSRRACGVASEPRTLYFCSPCSTYFDGR